MENGGSNPSVGLDNMPLVEREPRIKEITYLSLYFFCILEGEVQHAYLVR